MHIISNRYLLTKYKKIIFSIFFVSGFYFGINHHKHIRFLKDFLHGSPQEKINKSRPQDPRVELYENFTPKVSVVMIGDSITANAEWNDIFTNIKIANRGIGGDTSQDIFLRLDPIFSLNADKAFLMFGVNDILSGYPIFKISENYISIVKKLKKQGLKVYVQSTLECSIKVCGEKLKKIRKLNDLLKKNSIKHDYIFININNALTTKKQGLLNEYTYDGVHLNAKGYLRWRDAISIFIYSK